MMETTEEQNEQHSDQLKNEQSDYEDDFKHQTSFATTRPSITDSVLGLLDIDGIDDLPQQSYYDSLVNSQKLYSANNDEINNQIGGQERSLHDSLLNSPGLFDYSTHADNSPLDADSFIYALTETLPLIMTNNESTVSHLNQPSDGLIRPLLSLIQNLLSSLLANSFATAANAAARICHSIPLRHEGTNEHPNDQWLIPDQQTDNYASPSSSSSSSSSSSNCTTNDLQAFSQPNFHVDNSQHSYDHTHGHLESTVITLTDVLMKSWAGSSIANILALFWDELRTLQSTVYSMGSIIDKLTERLERAKEGLNATRRELQDVCESKRRLEHWVASMTQHMPLRIESSNCRLQQPINDLLFIPPPPPVMNQPPPPPPLSSRHHFDGRRGQSRVKMRIPSEQS